jgi:hypothetical protein
VVGPPGGGGGGVTASGSLKSGVFAAGSGIPGGAGRSVGTAGSLKSGAFAAGSGIPGGTGISAGTTGSPKSGASALGSGMSAGAGMSLGTTGSPKSGVSLTCASAVLAGIALPPITRRLIATAGSTEVLRMLMLFRSRRDGTGRVLDFDTSCERGSACAAQKRTVVQSRYGCRVVAAAASTRPEP